MGNSPTSPYTDALKPIAGGVQCRILLLGLDAVGKTSILRKLEVSEIFTTIPTIGFNVEEIEHKNILFHSWDIDPISYKQTAIRIHRNRFYQNTAALIFVVDSTDREKIEFDYFASEEVGCAKGALHHELSQDELRDAELLIFANKQDLPNAMDLFQIADKLGVGDLKRDWFIQASCAITGDGLQEGLQWLSHTLKNKRKKKNVQQYQANPDDEYTSWIDKQTYLRVLQNGKKSILFVCGWLRNENAKHRLNISANVCQLVHQFFQDKDIEYDKNYSFGV